MSESITQIDAVIDGLELVENVEGDPRGGYTVWFERTEHGEEMRQRNREMGTLLERCHFYGLLITDVHFQDCSIRLQKPQNVSWYDE